MSKFTKSLSLPLVLCAVFLAACGVTDRGAARDGDAERARLILDDFHEQVMGAVDAADRARLADLGGQADRLRNTLAQEAGAEALVSDLRRIARTIEIAWTLEAMRAARRAPATPEQFTVRARVLATVVVNPEPTEAPAPEAPPEPPAEDLTEDE